MPSVPSRCRRGFAASFRLSAFRLSAFRLSALGISAFCLLLTAGAGAQPAPPNGYPELLRAADLLARSRPFAEAQAESATLTLRRRALADRGVQQALVVLRQGLSRSVFTPPPDPGGEGPVRDTGRIRSLGRLLRLQQYVHLADGRTREALLTARQGLRLAAVVQSDSALNALVSVAIGGACLHDLGAHLDQFPLQDCELLMQVCLEWLNRADPLPRVLEGERRVTIRRLSDLRKMAEAESPAEAAALQPVLEEAQRRLDALYARCLAETGKPPWLRSLPEVEDRVSVGGELAAQMLPLLSRLLDTLTQEQTRIRLLACHSAVLRFRWEQGRLPAGLTELNLGDLAVDPFTGQPLQYRTMGPRRYRLTSAGPRVSAEDPLAVNGRRPVDIVPE